jgi:hypothetical protein
MDTISRVANADGIHIYQENIVDFLDKNISIIKTIS